MQEDTRTKILDAAIHLLETEGPRGFGQVRVAREAGLQQGHLTYYFPRKSDLAVAVLERLSERARAELARAVEQGDTLDATRAEAVFYELVRTLLRDRKRSQLLISLAAVAIEDAGVRDALAQQLREQRRVMAMLLRRDLEDPALHLALAALRGLGIESLFEPDDPGAVEQVIARFRAWLGPPAPRRKARARAPR